VRETSEVVIIHPDVCMYIYIVYSIITEISYICI
jgi:hypothetical protein